MLLCDLFQHNNMVVSLLTRHIETTFAVIFSSLYGILYSCAVEVTKPQQCLTHKHDVAVIIYLVCCFSNYKHSRPRPGIISSHNINLFIYQEGARLLLKLRVRDFVTAIWWNGISNFGTFAIRYDIFFLLNDIIVKIITKDTSTR